MWKNDEHTYGATSKLFHWVMTVLIIGLICVGVYMTGLDREDPLRAELTGYHKATGVIVLILALARIAWALYSPSPALPAALKTWEKVLARIATVLMYALMAVIPTTGIIMSDYADRPPSFLGLFKLPDWLEHNRDLAMEVLEWHETLAFTLLILILLHVAGALKHRYVDKSDVDVLERML
jgi:cytochrome b561